MKTNGDGGDCSGSEEREKKKERKSHNGKRE